VKHPSIRRAGIVSILAALLLASACSKAPDTTTASSGNGATTTTATAPTSTVKAPSGSTPGGTAPPTTSVAPAKATGAARPSAGCSAKLPDGLTPGKVLDAKISVAGTEHPYRLYVPASLTPGTPVPLIMDLHGLNEPHQAQAAVSGWETKSETDHFVVVTPRGGTVIPTWNSTVADDNPDTIYLRQLIEKTEAEVCIDESRAYVGGISNGGLESSIVGCKLADKVAAVGLVSGIVVPEPCKSVRPMPAVVFWGVLDCVLPFYGGLGACLVGGEKGVPKTAPSAPVRDGAVPPVEDAVAAWATRNGCDEKPTVTKVGEHTEKRTFTACKDGSAIELYVISNGGHTWPGSKAAASQDDDPNSPQGITTMEIDATALMWDFFQRFQVPA
jgi:polyhydroxybutyrate depolymerase